nr:MAG TPA: hypothetical protein [Caudoviricetes sp.]
MAHVCASILCLLTDFQARWLIQPTNRHPIRLIVSVGSLSHWQGIEPCMVALSSCFSGLQAYLPDIASTLSATVT